MENYIIKAMAYNKQVRIIFAENTDLIRSICDGKKINKPLKTALGNTLTVASLLTGILKGTQRISIKINASNRSHRLYADADSFGNVRGYINDEMLSACQDLPDDSPIGELIGKKGCLQVLKDIGMHGIFTGITDMPYGNIIDDFSYYFKKSEQTLSLFRSMVLYNELNEITSSRGIMVQLLPGAPIALLHRISKVISENQPILSASDLSKDTEGILSKLFEAMDIVGYSPVQFFCGCAKELFLPMLYSLSRQELMDACQDNKAIEMVCNVCGKKYEFTPEEISSLIQGERYSNGKQNLESRRTV